MQLCVSACGIFLYYFSSSKGQKKRNKERKPTGCLAVEDKKKKHRMKHLKE